MFPSRLCLLFLFASSTLYGAATQSSSSSPTKKTPKGWVAGQLVRISRDSPVFASPQGKSKILADVDAGTLLLLKEPSPQGTWLKVEDEDGNIGWIPANRTDYWDADKAEKEAQKAKKEEEQNSSERVSSEAPVDPLFESRRHQIWAVSHHSFRGTRTDPTGEWAWGLTYVFFHPSGYLKENSRRFSWLGFSLGYEHSSKSLGYRIPVGYRMWNQSASSSWGSGPDLGIAFYGGHPSGRFYWGIPIGYTLAWAPGVRGFMVGGRASVEFRNKFRPQIELTLGWNL